MEPPRSPQPALDALRVFALQELDNAAGLLAATLHLETKFTFIAI